MLPMIKHKACPFCGGKPSCRATGILFYQRFWIACKKCGASRDTSETPDDAWFVWDKRAKEAGR